ncbi:MAG: xanthine dehydrogenase family protein molybdopterin-binding subunit [Hyphomicrobiales bacterium]|nr:xanthine dehydrogenase family protein molybdopterin-binding subunit [Hyphomicrobiales bacterium]
MTEPDKRPFVGRSLLRREDDRLLTGQGQFVADLKLPNLLHAAFVRSQVAHARIRKVDLSRAAAAPGVVYVLSGADLLRILPPVPDTQLSLPRKWTTLVQHKFHNPQQPLLAHDKVRHVGEAIAVIVAESRYAAEDAIELVEVELEQLPAVVDPEAALATDAPVIHERFNTNLIGDFSVAKGNVDAALVQGPYRLQRRFYTHRYAASPMECRGVVSDYDPRTGGVTIWSASQVVHWVRREAASVLRLPEAQVRCLALDVGGGFGIKGHVYPEDLLIPFLARATGRPVRWIEDRHEHLMCSCHSRDQIHDVEVSFDRDGRILALRDSFVFDCGAWNPIGAGIPYNTAVHLPGPYKIEHFAVRGRIAVTNKVPNAPYRGAGRPEAALAIERSIDLMAGELGLEPAEVRRRNMVRPDEMPYPVHIPYRDGEPIVYDSGDYPGGLQKAIDAIGGVEAFRTRQHQARADGRYLGLGIGCYVEGTGVGPFESATVRIDPSGKVYVSSGACPQGQGMETIFAQIVADAWAVNPDDVVMSLADTSAIAIGFGTIASRSTVTLSAAIHHASEPLRKKVFAIAANLLECAAGDLELRDGSVGIVGVPGAKLTLAQVAQAARPGWDHGRPDGIEPGLESTYYFVPPTVTWSYAAHAAVVEVDIQLGRVKIEKYVIAHDCGVVVNPMLVEGQIIGGAAQGLGGALLEEFTYDNEGQLLTGSFMDYLLPTASDIPDMQLIHQHSPSPLNPLGVKGVGEGGAIAPPVVIANAVSDALKPFKVEFNATPIKPEQIVRATWSGSVAP